MMRTTSLLLVLIFTSTASGQYYESFTEQDRYGLDDATSKLVDNRGNGYESLYGVRNFRVVLKNVLYRGGANNLYNRNGKRDNRNPLQNEALGNLCKEGFTNVVYLYSTNYNSAPHEVTCNSRVQNGHQLDYLQLSPYNSKAIRATLQLVYNAIQDRSAGPIYVHCWNGWHASGLISAYALRQFCGVSGDDAVAYWDRNTDGANRDSAYEKIRRDIRNFKNIPELQIPEEIQSQICPSLAG